MYQFDFTQSEIAFNGPDLLSSQGFYHFGQLLIDATYLQPFKFTSSNSKKKEIRVKNNLRNGHIERESEGAIHASRVAWSTLMLHRLCQQQYPEQVQNKLQVLMAFSELSEEELFCLIRYVGLGHDAANEGGFSRGNSAGYIELFLKKHGLKPHLAELFSLLVSLKDKPKKLSEDLLARDLNEEVIEAFQYARLLVSLAVFVDMIRCCDSFKFKRIENALAEIFPYSQDQDASVFFDYVKQMLFLLKRQKDLRYVSIELIGPHQDKFTLQAGEEDYSVQEKVKLEHADNVLAAMLDSFNQDLYFQQLLKTETPEGSKCYDKEPAFNPYIHGTNSAALALMTKTDFRLMSVTEMLEQYELAPFCGEITRGGLDSAMAEGKSCFAKLSGEYYSNEYSLEKIMTSYASTQFRLSSKESCLRDLKDCSRDQPERLFSNISILNIYLARARQLGINLQEVREIQSLEENFRQVMDIFYLYLLFSTHLVVKKNGIQDWAREEQWAIGDEMAQHLSLQNMFQKIRESNISIREIYHHPTAENCEKIVALLTLPEHCKVQQLFEYTEAPLEEGGRGQLGSSYGYVVRNVGTWTFDCLLYSLCSGYYNRVDFQGIAHELRHYINTLEKRFSVTQRLLASPPNPLILSTEDLELLNNPLPIILCYNQSRHIRLLSGGSQEYRAQTPLKLGEEIQTIATDTETNIQRLKAYVDRHQLNLNIISFADLERAKHSLNTDYPLSTLEVIPYYADITKLHQFCEEQKNRLAHTSAVESLQRFQQKARDIILSQASSEEKRRRLKNCAHHEFEHRHYAPRLLADVLMLISSFAVVGLVVGIARIFTGHRFFFSSEKTTRETEFMKMADHMALSCN